MRKQRESTSLHPISPTRIPLTLHPKLLLKPSVQYSTILEDEVHRGTDLVAGGVKVSEIAEDDAINPSRYDPNHPLANEEGFVFGSNVNVMTEMVDIQAASRSFESAVEASNTAKRLMMRTIEMLKK